VVVCCSVGQSVAVYCTRARLVDAAPSEQLIEVRRHVWQCVAVCCSVWQCVTACSSLLQYIAHGHA